MERSLLQPTRYCLDRHRVKKNGTNPLRSGQNQTEFVVVSGRDLRNLVAGI